MSYRFGRGKEKGLPGAKPKSPENIPPNCLMTISAKCGTAQLLELAEVAGIEPALIYSHNQTYLLIQ
jgi:hypothetical protein